MEKYLQSIKKEFWRRVFKAELEYILPKLEGLKDILSVGCGPAVIEAGLAKHDFSVTGLDISEEALGQSSEAVRTVIGSAEDMDFADYCFDGVIYVASLQFIERYEEAVRQTARVLRPKGKLLVLLLNPKAVFFKEKVKNPNSYVSGIKHTDLNEIERTIEQYFNVQDSEFFLGIEGQNVFESRNPDLASLYVLKANKRNTYKDGEN